jgi:membrane protein DedA with SNARE-associated domain/rhodanese-related sulfurtransferase
MSHLLALIEQYGLAAVFVNILAEQLGMPIPAYPTMVVTGALLNRGNYSLPMLLAAAFSAALIADFTWYLAGKRYGRRVMKTLCRISLSPDSCVRQTESLYVRWGAPSLLVAKFVPGFNSIGSALAGTVGTRLWQFILFDGLGILLWAGSAIYLGSLFQTTIDDLLGILEQLGKWGLMLIAVALAAFVANKWWQRYRFIKSFRMARISVEELNTLKSSGANPTVIDVRPAQAQRDGRIPGAITIPLEDVDAFVLDTSRGGEIVVYCACPHEASAAMLAKRLMQKGFTKVRPLQGGIDAWMEAGYPVDVEIKEEKLNPILSA